MQLQIPQPRRSRPRTASGANILILIAVIFIVFGLAWGAYWVWVLAKREQTDDAYVSGNKVAISAQVSGTVIAVLADDTQLVKAAPVLVRLDPVDAETNLSRTAGALAQTVRQVRQEKATAEQYDSVIETRKPELVRSQADLAKREPLLADRAIAPEEVRHARESVQFARAALSQAVTKRLPRTPWSMARCVDHRGTQCRGGPGRRVCGGAQRAGEFESTTAISSSRRCAWVYLPP